jgi:hypothetical protein
VDKWEIFSRPLQDSGPWRNPTPEVEEVKWWTPDADDDG